MSSVLQCLSHTRNLSEYMVSNAFMQHAKGEFAKQFANILKALWLRNGSAVDPSAFVKFFLGHVEAHAKERVRFNLGQLHDAHELLNFLLDELSTDLSMARKNGQMYTVNVLEYKLFIFFLIRHQYECFFYVNLIFQVLGN
jgi:ubiquitin C-terminal hydrolase